MRDTAHNTTILCVEETDAVTARELAPNADIRSVSVALGDVIDNPIVVGRGNAREILEAANLGPVGRFFDLPEDVGLRQWFKENPNLVEAINDSAVDRFWHENRPLKNWTDKPETIGQSTGIDFLDEQWRWTPSELTIICGGYGCGKSSLTRLLAFHWAHTIGRPQQAAVSLCAFEDRRNIINRELYRWAVSTTQTQADAERLFDDMRGRLFWTERTVGEERLMSWYIDLVRDRVRRFNVRFFVFDPWNEHDFELAKNQSETDYVKEMMKRLQALVFELDVVVCVVTHISAKSYDENGSVKPFRVANAYGSSNFGAKATRGVCIAKTKNLREAATWSSAEAHMIIRTDKTKDNEAMGREITTACVFDPETMSLKYDAGATRKARVVWP
ncbi:MAG: AAA family ATPase [Hyphomicrobiaceae bacterium]